MSVADRLINHRPPHHTQQEPGQFIVTFPKSLHAGFSHGFNCAEAVNFSPPAWLPFGREAVERYRRFGRNPVFSHDRLVLTLASNLSADWSEASIRALLADLTAIVKEEEALRRELRAKGVRFGIVGKDKLPANQLAYMDDQSLDYDEKRACLSCRHVCFLSAVACECDALQVACLREAARLCGCRMERRFLLAWHDMDELWEFVEKVRRFLEEHPRRRAVGGGGHKDPAHPHEESKETKVEGPGLVVKEEAAAAPAE